MTRLVGLYQEQLDYVAQVVELTEMFFRKEVAYSDDAGEILSQEQVPIVVEALIRQLESTEEELTADTVKQLLKAVQKETGYKGKQLFMPVRAAVTGEVHGPDLRETISLLGKETVLARLESFLRRQA